MMDIICNSAKKLATAIYDKELSSEEVVNEYVKQIEEVNPKLNAVVQLTAEEAIRQAKEADKLLAKKEIKGPLHGVPMTIKDSLDTAGIITTWGTPGRKNYIPREDATVVKRVKKAGAILLGKTNTPEFTLAYETDNPIYGRTNNPYNFEQTPGGSSGGEAAIIAACGSPVGIGSDTGGSIRVPAHFCGLAGIKPTSGRVPRTGHAIPYGHLIDSLTQLGPIARYVEDLALILSIIAGEDGIDPFIVPMPLHNYKDVNLKGMNAAIIKNNDIITLDEETAKVLNSTAKIFSEAGVNMNEIHPSGIEESFNIYMGLLFGWDGGDLVRLLLDRAGTAIDESSLGLLLSDSKMSSMELLHLIEQWVNFRQRVISSLNKYDLILSPVNAYHTMPHGTSFDNILGFSYTMTFNLTGSPAGVVRAGTSEKGLPIGIQIAAKPWREDIVLAALDHIEQTIGGWQAPSINDNNAK
jgi:amidase